jgi:hypothetical protein
MKATCLGALPRGCVASHWPGTCATASIRRICLRPLCGSCAVWRVPFRTG